MSNEDHKIGVIMEKLETMHESLKTIVTETKATNGKVAETIKDIALIKQENNEFLKKSELGKSLWGYVTAILMIVGVFQFLFAGWFENKINKSIEQNFKEDIGKIVAEEITKNYEFIITN